MHPTVLLVFGKRTPAPLVATSDAGTNSRLLFTTDRLSHTRYLIDTGAAVSVVPALPHDRMSGEKGSPLRAANGTRIATYGTRTLFLDLGLNRTFKWTAIIADVSKPILGADFLRQSDLLIDLTRDRLIDAHTFYSTTTKTSSEPTVGLSHFSPPCPYHSLLESFPSLTTPCFKRSEVRHDVKHHIETEGPPVFARFRRLSPEKLQIAKKEFEEMLSLGIIRPSKSNWSSPLHLVPKPHGRGWRPCGDFRRLNSKTKDDRYPIPNMQDFATILEGKTIFSKIDLVRGFHHIPLAEGDIPPFGLFEFLFMPFGLKTAPQTFQRFMDSVFRGLDFVFVYIDDLLVASTSPEEHRHHLRLVFERLAEHGLAIHPAKCEFGLPELSFLGHHVSASGTQPLPERVQAVCDFPQPVTTSDLMRYLGLIHYYHRFIPKCAEQLHPLHQLIRGQKPNNTVTWTPEAVKSFEASRNILANAALLVHPSFNAGTRLTTDASDLAVGGTLEQLQGGKWVPIAFFSKSLQKAETRYSAFDRELLGLYLAIKHFRYFLEGRSFTAYTDHKPLTFALSGTGDAWSPRQSRHLSFISEFTTDLRHITGKQNVAADALSRAPVNELDTTTTMSLDYDNMAMLQENDPDIQAYRTAITGLRFDAVPVPGSNRTLLCDVSQHIPRPIVPKSLRRLVFDTVHNLAHPGVKPTQRLITERFVWHGINKNIASWVKSCSACQLAKIHRHTIAPLEQFTLPKSRFDCIHVDIVGPLPQSHGHRSLFTIIDRFTRWPEAIPMIDISAESCAKALLSGWFSRFGLPKDITSDRGRQFVSHLWMHLLAMFGIQAAHTTAYHPQANGMVERFHRQMKASLKAKLNSTNWFNELPLVLLGIRTALKQDIGCSAAEMVYGQTLRLPGEFFTPSSQDTDQHSFLTRLKGDMARLRPTQTRNHTSKRPFHIPHDLLMCSHVFMRIDCHRAPLDCPYRGPYRVLARSDKFFTLDLNTRVDTVSIDRLKPAFLDVLQEHNQGTTLPSAPAAAASTVLPVNPPTVPPLSTRYGRLVQAPSRLNL